MDNIELRANRAATRMYDYTVELLTTPVRQVLNGTSLTAEPDDGPPLKLTEGMRQEAQRKANRVAVSRRHNLAGRVANKQRRLRAK